MARTIPIVSKFSAMGIHHSEFEDGLHPNIPLSPLGSLVRDANTETPAYVEVLGNVYVDSGQFQPDVLMKPVNPSDLGKAQFFLMFVNHPNLFGKYLLPFPLKYREVGKRTTHRYNILRHHMQDRKFSFIEKYKDGGAVAPVFPNDFEYARGYISKDSWWNLYPLDNNTRRKYHLLTDIHPMAFESVFPGECKHVVEEIPYDPGPFICTACRNGHFEVGYDVVLFEEIKVLRRYQPGASFNQVSPSHRFKDNRPIVLFLAPFCPSCFMTLRMLGLLKQEKV